MVLLIVNDVLMSGMISGAEVNLACAADSNWRFGGDCTCEPDGVSPQSVSCSKGEYIAESVQLVARSLAGEVLLIHIDVLMSGKYI